MNIKKEYLLKNVMWLECVDFFPTQMKKDEESEYWFIGWGHGQSYKIVMKPLGFLHGFPAKHNDLSSKIEILFFKKSTKEYLEYKLINCH